MMKIQFNKPIVALLLTSALFTACSESIDPIMQQPNGIEHSNGANISFRLQANTSTGIGTRSTEDSYEHTQGTPDEYKVNNARVYLFDTPTKLFVKSIQLKNITRTGTDNNGYVIYETDRVSVPQGTYDIFVTANTDRVINCTYENDFLADIDSATYVRGQIEDISRGIVMTNRGADNAATVIANTETTNDNVITVTLERALARIDVAKASESFQLTDDQSKLYATVTLDGYYVVNLPKYFYSFRHAAQLTSLLTPAWNLSENFGNVKDVNGYVIDPYFFNKTIDASNFTNADKYYENYFGDYSNPNSIQWKTFLPNASGQPQFRTMYSLENCMLAPAQKNGYSTGIIFRAKVEPANNVFRLNAAGNLELVTDKTLYPEVLYYFNYNFYTSAEALASALGVATVSTDNLDIYQARKFEKTDDGYRCYYNYWVRHLDNYKPTSMGVMEFAIVRNNLYRIMVSNVSGLGYQALPINPDTPDEGETYLKVLLNVKPWIVRDLTNIVL